MELDSRITARGGQGAPLISFAASTITVPELCLFGKWNAQQHVSESVGALAFSANVAPLRLVGA